jgi:hypothetical protein
VDHRRAAVLVLVGHRYFSEGTRRDPLTLGEIRLRRERQEACEAGSVFRPFSQVRHRRDFGEPLEDGTVRHIENDQVEEAGAEFRIAHAHRLFRGDEQAFCLVDVEFVSPFLPRKN